MSVRLAVDRLLDLRGIRTRVQEFEAGGQRMFDTAPLLGRPQIAELKASPHFLAASVTRGTVVWPDKIDIAPETLYECSTLP
jgi:hypothetical protein